MFDVSNYRLVVLASILYDMTTCDDADGGLVMKKAFLIVAMVLCLAGCSSNVDEVKTEILRDELESVGVEIESVMDEAADNYAVNVEKPLIKSLDHKETETFINQKFDVKYEEINSQVVEMKAMSEDDRYELYIKPNEIYNKKGILTIGLEQYQYTGGTHGEYWTTFYNFDILDNKELALEELFKVDVEFEQLIYNYVAEQVEDDEYKYSNVNLLKDEKKPLVFYLGDDQINIYFGIYVIASYAEGEQRFPLPYELLEGKLSPLGESVYNIK